MSYDSNTKVALLNEQFARLLLVAFTAGYVSDKANIDYLLHNYRGVASETRYDQITNILSDAFYLTEVSSVFYDGNRLIFGTYGWYNDVNIHFHPREGKIVVMDGSPLVLLTVPGTLHESCYMVKSLADEILGKSKDFKAVPSKNGHDLKRTYK